MHRNYQKYNKLDTSRYSKGIKNSLYSLVSIIIGLLFTYLAMTKQVDDKKMKKNEKVNVENRIDDDYSFVSINSDNKAKLGPPKENKEKDEY